MDQIIVQLKQHTPLLHFQAPQDGATLRASEVKPRLDAFLREQGIPVPRYKMRIVTEGERKIRETSEPKKNGRGMINTAPMFFGNGKTMVSSPSLTLSMTVFQGSIPQDKLVSFFAQNNFGTRQTKGYGAFTVESINGSRVSDPLPKRFVSYFEMKNADWSSVFRNVELLHKTLRSGLNGQSPYSLYFKSLLFSYAESKNLVWDKRIIKQHFLSNDIKNEVEAKRKAAFDALIDKTRFVFPAHSDPGSRPYRQWTMGGAPRVGSDGFDLRDYLGLSTYETWMSYDTGKIISDEKRGGPKFRVVEDKRTGVKKNELVLEKMYVAKAINRPRAMENSDSPGRFKSPILYKPVTMEDGTWRVYVIVDESAQKNVRQMGNQTICYRSNMPGAEDFRLGMAPSFSIMDYLKYAFGLSEGDLRRHFSVNWGRVDLNRLSPPDKQRYCDILSIYSDLNRNLK